MKQLFSLLFFLAFVIEVNAQKMYTTNSGQVKLKTSTLIENYNAVNNQAESRWLESNGQIFFSVLIKDFKFENPLMETDFNEHYIESGKFPKAEFKGFIQDIQHIDLTNSGGNVISADGILTIHGVAQKVMITGILTVLSSGKIMLKSELKVKWKDFNISTTKMDSKLTPEAIISIYCIYE
jgi:hypothetical protein